MVDGQPAHVFGHDECPKHDSMMHMLFGPTTDEGLTSCLVIPPSAKTVFARVAINGNLTNEIWSVEHIENKPYNVFLRRPDGLPVIFLKKDNPTRNEK